LKDNLIFAIDFDGTLCENAFPAIGELTSEKEELINLLITLREEGHQLILYTCRGDNASCQALSEAVNWCREYGLEFDAINENVPNFKKVSGFSPKPYADIYLDDKALNIRNWRQLHEYVN